MAKKAAQQSEPESVDVLPDDAVVDVSSGRRPRRPWWPAAALSVLLIALAATVVTMGQVTLVTPDAKGAFLVATPRLEGLDSITAPVPTATPDPKSFAQKIEIILPPPPPPAPSGGGGKKKKGSGIAPGTGGYTYTEWCNAGGGASASASSLEGLLAAANAERAKWGFGALSWNSSLASLAQDWSNTMAANYIFEDPANKNVFKHRGGVPENIAISWRRSGDGGPASISQSTALANAHAGWMTSAGHCKNILKPSYTSMGAGVATTADGSTVYTTVNFG